MKNRNEQPQAKACGIIPRSESPSIPKLEHGVFRTRNKGQIETIVMTIVFLLIAVGVVFFAIFSLIAAKGNQFQLSVAAMGGTSHPINFASGALGLRWSEGRSVLEMAVQAIGLGERKVGRDAVAALRGLTGFFQIDSYSVTLKSENTELASANNFVKFCGKAAEGKYAYCNPIRTIKAPDGTDVDATCPFGSSEFPEGKAACNAEEKCCVENYEFRDGRTWGQYKNIPKQLECGNPSQVAEAPQWGICEDGCSPGRTEIEILPHGIGCGKALTCCMPSLTTRSVTEAADSVTIPLVYRQTPGNPAGRWGSLEVSISTPKVIE